jgi:ribonuclease HI
MTGQHARNGRPTFDLEAAPVDYSSWAPKSDAWTMGHYCRICDRERPKEAFSGRGHRNHVCKKCQRLPHAQRALIQQLDELFSFLVQSHISPRNVLRLQELARSEATEVRDWSTALLEVARHYPYRSRRYVRMVRERPELLGRLRRLLGDAWWNELMAELGSSVWDEMSKDGDLEGQVNAKPPAELPSPSSGLAARHAEALERRQVAHPSTEGCPGPSRVIIHTDGACQHNPGPGGWAAILRYGKHVKELTGSEPSTTNNRMELQAAIAGLRALKKPCAVELVTDSKYLRDGVTRWLTRWKANGWKTVERVSVKNRDLWEQLDAECARHEVTWSWVRGHVGHPDNERCDELARTEISRLPGPPVAERPRLRE